MKYFLITIDTEGDNAWAKPAQVTTRNAAYLPRFQALCERYGMKPTYLANYEMANEPDFVELARAAVKAGTAEVGMHLHAWTTPPLVSLTDDDMRHQPYLIEYPTTVMREKCARMTDVLTHRFDTAMVSHRAGRWALNSQYARILVELGYRVDCSVTPHASWRHHPGAPGKAGGTDYRRFPQQAYFMDLDHIDRPGDSPLLEVPMTIVVQRYGIMDSIRRRFRPDSTACRAIDRFFPLEPKWLRPRGRNRADLIAVVENAAANGVQYVEFMLHSSEFMPGGSPTFPDAASIDRLYDDLEALFEAARGRFIGATLREFHDHVLRERGRATPRAAAVN